MAELRGYRIWFAAAAVYNALWGLVVSVWPAGLFELLHMPQPTYPALTQCIGMMVGVYAIGYALVAIDPIRYGPFVYIGLAGKILGPVGFVVSAFLGELPWRFGWVNVFNDVIWLPVFVAFGVVVFQRERKARSG